MSILIKGMNLPTAGMIGIIINNEGKAFVATKTYDVVELPQHGRLIDIDDIDNIAVNIRITNKTGIDVSLAAPTIIEADDSIKRAEWEKHNDGIMYWWECSKCHHDAWYDGDDLYNYCPWCGAKMTIIEAEETKNVDDVKGEKESET